MGTILAKDIVSDVQTIIQDQTGVRWPLDELLQWLNEGQRQIVILRPDAYSVTEAVHLVAGSKQKIPEAGIRLLDVIRNMGIDGSTPGDAVTFCERNHLDTQRRGWHYQNPAATVLHFVYDDREPTTFYTFPPQPGSGQGWVDLVFSKSPPLCTIKDVINKDGTSGSANSVISLDDIYEPPLKDFVVYRSYCKNQTYVRDGTADAWWTKFLSSLGLKTEADKAFTPRKNAPPDVNRNVPANTGAFGDR